MDELLDKQIADAGNALLKLWRKAGKKHLLSLEARPDKNEKKVSIRILSDKKLLTKFTCPIGISEQATGHLTALVHKCNEQRKGKVE
mgnify:CR=1 FL=1